MSFVVHTTISIEDSKTNVFIVQNDYFAFFVQLVKDGIIQPGKKPVKEETHFTEVQFSLENNLKDNLSGKLGLVGTLRKL